MNYIKRIILLLLLFYPSLSLGKSIDDLFVRNQIYFNKFSDSPFTGKVKGRINCEIINGLRDGNWEVYYKQDLLDKVLDKRVLKIKGFFKRGSRERTWEYYFDNGNLFAKGKYLDNSMVGKWSIYYDSGELRLIKDFGSDMKSKTYYVREFWHNGNIKTEGNAIKEHYNSVEDFFGYKDKSTFDNFQQSEGYYRFLKIKWDGVWKEYKESGILNEIKYWKDKRLINTQKAISIDDLIYMHDIYVLRKIKRLPVSKEIILRDYGFTGEVFGDTNGKFINGKKNGTFRFYNENGQLISKSNFKDGLQDGDFFSFYDNGSVEIKGFYKDDRPHGEWRYYSLFNILERKVQFENGKEIKN